MIIVASLFLSVSALSFADPRSIFQEKIKGHWSEKLLRPQIPELYFPDYAEENVQKFNPSELIIQSAVYRALNRLYLWHNLPMLARYDIGGANNIDKHLNRKDILLLLEPFALKFGEGELTEISFVDCEKLNPREKNVLAILVDLKILSGESKTRFSPERKMTQSEAMIVVQKIFDFLERTFIESLPKSARKTDFKVKHCKRTYDNVEGISFEQNEKSVFITVIKQFSTPGYKMHVQRVFVSEEGFHIDLNISSPSTNMEVAQVITYESLIIEIPKSDATKNIPLRAWIKNMNLPSLIE